MTPDAFLAIAKRITYKPDWSLKFERPNHREQARHRYAFPWDGVVIGRMMRNVLDAGDSSAVIPLEATEAFSVPPGDVDVDYVVHMIREWIIRLEMHELDEWFRFGGQPVVETHANRYKEGRL